MGHFYLEQCFNTVCPGSLVVTFRVQFVPERLLAWVLVQIPGLVK